MYLYLVRHGQSELDHKNIHRDHTPSLSKEGEQQAAAVAKRFSRIAVDAVMASDYVRARETADEIARVTGKEIIEIDLLREQKRPSEIIGKQKDDPEAVAVRKEIVAHKNDPFYHYSDEENFFEFRKRAQEFLHFLSGRDEESVVAVSHGRMTRMLVAVMMHGEVLTPDLFGRLYAFLGISNTGITLCRSGDKNAWQLITWNDHAHLG